MPGTVGANRARAKRASARYLPGMRRRSVALLFFVLVLTAPAASAATPADPLWLAGVASTARAKTWSPGDMRILIEMADDKGRVLDTWDNRYRIIAAPDGALTTEVVAATHNGKDETRKEREAQAKRDAPADASSPWSRFLDDPLDPEVQDSLSVRRLAATRTFSGVPAVAFAFVLAKADGATVEGTAWLDAAAGLPLEISSTPRPLPRGAHELATVVRYADGFPAEVRVVGSGSLLFFKRRFASLITLGGWFARPVR